MFELLAGLALALLISIGVNSCQYKEVGTLKASIEANKVIAKKMLSDEVARGKADSIQSQKDYDDALKTLSITNRHYAGQLRDPGRRNSCHGPAAGTTAVPQDTSTGSEFSPEAGKLLRSEADRADFAAIYALKCQQYAIKPTIRSQIEAIK